MKMAGDCSKEKHSLGFFRTLLAAAVLFGVGCGNARAQAPIPGEYSAEKYELQERRGVMVPMGDGVQLIVDLYMPKTAEKMATILGITPYGRSTLYSTARWFARRGYVFVAADSRGRFDSEGTWDPFNPKHKTDGYDLVEWLAPQPWANGRVGMWGASYMGWTQWWTATTTPPHLAAIAPWSAPTDQAAYQGGALAGWILDWAAVISGRTNESIDDGPYWGWIGRQAKDLKHTPYSDINAYRGIENAPWFAEWYRQNRSTNAYWQGIASQDQEHYSRIGVPSLSITGWFDPSYQASPMNYVGMKSFGATPEARRPSMIIGPWLHAGNNRGTAGIDYGATAQIDMNGYVVRWFDHFLKGINNGVERDPPVYVFVMGENKWHAESDWPIPESRPTKFYLTSGGHANSLKGDGRLTTVPPRQETSDHYTYDPHTPTLDPFANVPNRRTHLAGALDTRPSAIGDDVLVYQTPLLASPVEVIGPIEATLYAATSARDTDWMVRLVDVLPDGTSLLLADGVMRARSRDPANEGRDNPARLSMIEPGKTYRYTIRFWRGTGNVFGQGHRIGVEISSSWFPSFLANLNTGADNLAMVSMSEAIVAHQIVQHGGKYPSYILLPVIPSGGGGLRSDK